MIAAEELAPQVGVEPACRALGVSRATFYRRKRPTPGHQQPRPTPARALSTAERERVVEVLSSERFVDRSPTAFCAETPPPRNANDSGVFQDAIGSALSLTPAQRFT